MERNKFLKGHLPFQGNQFLLKKFMKRKRFIKEQKMKKLCKLRIHTEVAHASAALVQLYSDKTTTKL